MFIDWQKIMLHHRHSSAAKLVLLICQTTEQKENKILEQIVVNVTSEKKIKILIKANISGYL